ncbi:hypothetical protein [Deinococcus radiophilus]|uniref:Uncharacterized protein n=1 Tax=Deinococcus radiophilus TaxID=32062 RepID=A0A431VSY8_9DEIO|nr:hypothetical protein [Deinococcus radiophilus]RTR26352.1 hypothetical protein EJ104_08405 [Deinococcus radiophilus]UFA51999.1 hypothetical protein LMT64_13480 [Deinococcus radiophilus]
MRRLLTLPGGDRILLDSGRLEFPDLDEVSSGKAPHYVQVHQITSAWKDWAAVPEHEWQALAAQVGGTLSARPLPDRAQLPLELLGCFRLRFPGGGELTYSVPSGEWSDVAVTPSSEAMMRGFAKEMDALHRVNRAELQRLFSRYRVQVPSAPVGWERSASQGRRHKPAGDVLAEPLAKEAQGRAGSLTSYLALNPVARQAIDYALNPQRSRPVFGEMVQPLPDGYSAGMAGLIGTSFDYALRYLLAGTYAQAVWTPLTVPARYAVFQMDRERVLAEVGEACAMLEQITGLSDFGPEQARAATVLASYDVVARTGRFQELAGPASEVVQRDVLGLIQAVPLERFRPERHLIAGPLFAAAGRVGGADADLLIDDTLIEVKATRKPSVELQHLRQLVGYLVLERLGGIDHAEVPVRRVGFYYARYGVLHTWTVPELFRPGTLPRLVGWFDDSLPSRPAEAH